MSRTRDPYPPHDPIDVFPDNSTRVPRGEVERTQEVRGGSHRGEDPPVPHPGQCRHCLKEGHDGSDYESGFPVSVPVPTVGVLWCQGRPGAHPGDVTETGRGVESTLEGLSGPGRGEQKYRAGKGTGRADVAGSHPCQWPGRRGGHEGDSPRGRVSYQVPAHPGRRR